MKVCMFVTNNCKYDHRVLKEAKTLTDAGHEVRIIAILDKNTEPYEERDGFRIIRVTRDPIHYQVLRAVKKQPTLFFAIAWIRIPLRLLYVWLRRPLRMAYRRIRRPLRVAYRRIRRPLRVAYRWIQRFIYTRLRAFLLVFHRPLSLIDYYRRSWQAIKDEPADVYHSHDLTTLPIGYIAKRRSGGQLVYDSHELFTEVSGLGSFERRIFHFLEKRLIHRADGVVTVSESIAQELSNRYGVALPNIIMNCPPRLVLKLGYYKSTLRKKLGLNDTVPIILFVGGYSPGRGLHNLILSAHHINEGIVVFMGWGKLEEELKDLVREEDLGDRVLFARPVPPDDVVREITSASLGVAITQFVCLNNYYGSPNRLFEYVNAGLPVVGSNFPEVKRIVEGYRLGKTFDPEDPRDIAAAINWVLLDKKRYEEMKQNALKAAEIFNWKNEAKKLLTLYQRLESAKND